MPARTDDPVRTIMSTPAISLDPATTLGTAAQVLRDQQIGALAVVDQQRLVGLFSERDLVTAVADGRDLDVDVLADAMSDRPYPVSPETPIADATQVMLRAGIRHLPVTAGDEVVGMVSIRDALNAYDGSTESTPQP